MIILLFNYNFQCVLDNGKKYHILFSKLNLNRSYRSDYTVQKKMNTLTNTTTLLTSTGYDTGRAGIAYVKWIITNSISITLALVCLYLTGSQIIFLFKKHRFPYSTAKNLSSNSGRSNINDRQATNITIMCIIGSFSAFLRAGVDLRLVLGSQTDSACNVANKFTTVVHLITVTAVYMALWMRQRIFYQDTRLKHLSSKSVRCLSWFTAVFFNVTALATMGIFLFGVNYKGTPYGCAPIPGIITTARYIILVLVTTVFQIIFLALFIYPLFKHRQSLKSGKAEHGKSMIKIMKRVTIITIVCVITDLMTFLGVFILGPRTRVLFYNINFFVNVISLIHSFSDWRMRVMPWRIKGENKETLAKSKAQMTSL